MKIYRADELAVLYRSFRFARRNTLAVGMLGLFPFGRSELAGLRSEADLWDVVSLAMGEAVLDEGYPKPAGEFKVYGNAHAGEGKTVQEMLVSARLGQAATKQLLVIGDRHFNALGLLSSATPFSEMPLTPQQAFGGPQFAANPQGKGAVAQTQPDGSKTWPLPNVEWMRARIVSRGDQADPAGFWALDAASPQRAGLLGRFDDQWLKHTWPYLPEDTHAEYFHTVPNDQRNTGYYRGDEDFELRGMHRQHAALAGRLPGLRARCFVNRRQGGAERFSEIEARLDTVWLFPEYECGIVLYRAQSDVHDEDASDVLHVMAEWERLQDAPLAFAHYEALFRQRLREDAGAAVAAEAPLAVPEEVLPATDVPAVPAQLQALAALAAVPAMSPEMLEAQQAITALERQTAELLSKNGLTQADVDAMLKADPDIPAVSMEEAQAAVGKLEAQTRELMLKNNISDADVQKLLQQPPEQESSLADVKAALRDMDQQTAELLRKNNLTEGDVKAFLSERSGVEHAVSDMVDSRTLNATVDAIPDVFPAVEGAVFPADAFGIGDLAALSLPGISLAHKARPQLTREQVVERHAAKESLADFDLSGVDLSKLDLAGADFSGSLLEGTVFAGSRLANAKLAQCLMQGADCSEADFSGADLAGASAGGAKFAKARLPGAQLREADFTGADFSEAQLQKAVLDGAIFEQAAMAKLQAAGVSAVQGNFSGADLSGADFAQATLSQAMFNECKLGAANFKAAQCQSAEFYGADASGAQFAAAVLGASRADASSQFGKAVFDGAQLQRAAWEGAQLAGAQFVGARLDDADFSSVQAAGANFRQASAKQAKFGRADLSRADMTGINLFKGSLRKSRVEDAVLHFANLYGADFEGVTVRSAALEGADIERTLFAFRPPLA